MGIGNGGGLLGTLLALALVSTVSACGGSSSTTTRGSQCHEVAVAFCGRAASCRAFPDTSPTDCINSSTTGCCAGDCGGPVLSTESDIRVCTDAFAAESCADISVPTSPSTCLGVVRSPLAAASGALTARAAPGAASTNRIEQIGARFSHDFH